MKRLLFVTTRIFWPADNGRKVSLYHYCKGLHEQYGYEIHLYTFLEAEQKYLKETKPDFIKTVEVASPIGKIEIARNLIRHSMKKNIWPLQSCLFYSKENAKRLKRIVQSLSPDVIMVDMIRTAQYYPAFSESDAIKILDMDDLLSRRYERKLLSGDTSNLMGSFGPEGSSICSSSVRRKIERRILKEESRRADVAERRFSEQYDSVVFVSEPETRLFSERTKTKKAVTVTLGVDYEYFSEPIEPAAGVGELAFLGNMKWEPNVASLRFIADSVLPRLGSGVKLSVIGAAPNTVVSSFKAYGNIEFTGRVDDLRPYLAGAKVFLSPIVYGSGIKTKILEAMAMGLPVVTNSVGAEGLLATDGEELFIEESPEAIARIVTLLLNDSDLREQTGKKARAYIKANHVWNDIMQRFSFAGL